MFASVRRYRLESGSIDDLLHLVDTDFAETEGDERRVNLTRFPLFFEERRAFFLDGLNFFEFPPGESSPFFSRRIGLNQGEPQAVLYGANMSYLTPVGYQTNLLVMSAGGYRFSDFLRAGIPLQIIMWLGISFMLPLVYGL